MSNEKFCPYCGNPKDASGRCNCPESVAVEQKEKNKWSKIKKFSIPAALLVASLVIVACVVSYRSSIIDLSDYLVIGQVMGLNGDGRIECYLDEAALYDAVYGEIDYDSNDWNDENFEDSLREEIEREEAFSKLLSCITVSANKDAGLSNGDVVKITVQFQNKNGYKFANRFKNGSASVTVSGLREGKMVELFAEGMVEVKFSGVNGFGKATLTVQKPVGLEDCFSYQLSDTQNLSNGDVVMVDVTVNKQRLEERGYLTPSITEKPVTVFGLKEPVAFDPFAESIVSLGFSGFSGLGEAEFTVVKPEGTRYYLKYSLSANEKLANGDVVTITVTADSEALKRLGYLVPEISKKDYTVSGLPELFELDGEFPKEALEAHIAAAWACIQEELVQSGNSAYLNDGPAYVKSYYIQAKDITEPYYDVWSGYEFTNAVCVVETYTVDFGMGFYRTYWYVYLFQDYHYNGNGNLVYNTDKEQYFLFVADSFEEFEQEFKNQCSEMNITEIG